MARAIGQRRSGPSADATALARSSPSHTLRGPTAKLSASFRPHFANGPTLAPIRIRINDQPNFRIGSIAPIGIGQWGLESQHTYQSPRLAALRVGTLCCLQHSSRPTPESACQLARPKRRTLSCGLRRSRLSSANRICPAWRQRIAS